MTALSLVGPSYGLKFGGADNERTINYVPVQIESGNGKGGSPAYLKQIPGLSLLASLGAEIRGAIVARDVMYVAAGSALYRVSDTWVATNVGSLLSSFGLVGMAVNNTQIAIVDGPNLHVFDLDTLAMTTNPANWRRSDRVDVLDGYGVFQEPQTNQFYISANQDFTVFDGLDFASAEGSTGYCVGFIVKHRELLILKQNTGEVWQDTGGSDFAFSRNDGANIEVGNSAVNTLQKTGGVAYWLGRDEKGGAAVFAMSAYSPQRVSSHALEEKLEGCDLSNAYAFTYHQDGLTYYVLQVADLDTTWVLEIASGMWHERAELVNGEYAKWRANSHVYAYGVHLVGDSTGKLYKLDTEVNTNNGETLVRDRITPHLARPDMRRQRIGSMQIDCEVGNGLPSGQQAQMMLRYSDDGGKTWGNWRYLTLGNIGQYKARARANMLGSTRDRVWHIRVTDDVHCDILAAVIDEV